MKKKKSCLTALLLSLTVLSGCGMAEDGYIEDRPAQTRAPMESPYLSPSPLPTDTPLDEETADKDTDRETADVTPSPDDEQNETADK